MKVPVRSRFLLLALSVAVTLSLNAESHNSLTPALVAQTPSTDEALLASYRWRSIGPPRGGRSIAVAGVKGRPREAYFGAVGGGLWKTIDAGNTWAPVTDGQIGSSSVGAVAVSESNPDVVYIGMGESCIRGNIMPGDGVYKSTDAGKTWTRVGFANVDAISKIRVHPTNPDIVYVAAFGQYYGPSDERGVFKSTDGGKTWRNTLFRDPRTGAVDLAIDSNNPNVIFAALWEAYRLEYQMSSGGPGSSLFKSTDGGDTWTEITRNQGLPAGMVGRIGVALTKADSNRVYALVENEKGGLFVSDDAGATWRLMNESRTVRQRAFYYTHVHADQRNKDVVYMLNTALFRSTDAGKTTAQVGQGTHGDHHDLWVDPDDSDHIVVGNDGGGAISFNMASAQRTWSDQDFPTAQWYHVVTTAHLPFHVCGAQQDNSTLCVPSNTNAGGGFGGAPPVAPYQVGGGEPGYIAPDRTNTDIFFAGSNNGTFLTRYNQRTGELKEVGAYPRFFSGEPAKDVKERWQWTYPIIFSPVDPKVLYTSSQRVWRSTNGGDTWEAISGDLSRHDPKTFEESGGPITHDMNSPEIYGTVFSLAPGKRDINVMWAGSDDGLIHVTRDHGKAWTNVTPREMPDFGRVSQIDGSPFDNGTAYVAVKKMLLGDRAPYIFRTRDYGKSWTKIVNGIAANDYVHVVREDVVRRGLLYAGTQHGAYVSFNDGEEWRPFKNGLPDTPVADLVVEKNALAIGTHGRSFYVIDDVAALRQLGTSGTADVVLFKPADVTRGLDRAGISYYLKAQPKNLTIEFLDAKGQVIRSINGQPPAKPGEQPAGGGGGGGGGFGGPQGAPMAAGVNRYSWDLNSTPVVSFPGMILWGATQNGPMVLPGSYTVRLNVDGAAFTQPFAIAKHPLRPISDADLQYQWDLASRIRDKVNEANRAVINIRRIKSDIAARTKDAPKEVQDAGASLAQALSAVEEDVYQVRNQSGQDPLNFPIKTNNRLASLLRVAVTGEGRPTGNVEVIFNDLIQELKGHTDRLDRTLTTDLPAFNRMLERNKREPIKPQ